MEKFNLEKYNTGNYDVITRDGHNARVLCTDLKANNDIVIAAAIEDDDGYEHIVNYHLNGLVLECEHYDDLMLIKWKPKDGEYYYYIDVEGGMFIIRKSQFSLTEIGANTVHCHSNFFKTEEAANLAVKKIIKLLEEL